MLISWYREGRVYNSNPFAVSVLHHPSVVFLIEESGKHCTGGWVGLRVGPVGTEKPTSIGIRSPYRPAQCYTNYFISTCSMTM
jgi:hypothetical protein